MMNNHKKEKLETLFQKLASEFFQKIEAENVFINICRVEFSDSLNNVKIFISSYPEKNEQETLKLVEKKKGEFKKYIASKTKLKFIPDVDFEADRGEKNRRRIEELLQK